MLRFDKAIFYYKIFKIIKFLWLQIEFKIHLETKSNDEKERNTLE